MVAAEGRFGKNVKAGSAIFEAVKKEFGEESVRYDLDSREDKLIDFPVRLEDDRIASARSVSEVLSSVPTAAFDYVFIAQPLEDKAKKWLAEKREEVLKPAREDDA